MAHGPGDPMTTRQLRQIGVSGSTYVTPAQAQRMSRGNVPPVKTQPAQLAGAVPQKEWAPVQKQRLLASMGYAITTDGSWGPQSEMAWQAYQKGIPPQYWNQHAPRSNVRQAQALDHPSASVQPSAPPAAGAGPGVAGNSPAHTGAGNTPSSNPDLFGALMQKLQSFKFIDPNSYANALTNQQYQPQVADFQRQIATSAANGDQANTDIGNWFDQVLKRQGDALQFNKDNATNAQNSIDAAAKGIMGALGGSANAGTAGIGAEAANQEGLINNLSLAQQGFDKDMGAILGAQKADAQTSAQRMFAQQGFDLNSKLSDLLGQRANALATNKANATNQYLGQLGQYQNLLLGASMAPGEMTLQNLKIAGQKTQNAASAAQLKQFVNTYVKGQNGGVIPKWNRLDPGTLGKLQNAAIGAVQNAVLLNHATPQQAYQLVGNLLRNYSQGFWDPAKDGSVEQFRRRLLQQLFTRQQFPAIYGK